MIKFQPRHFKWEVKQYTLRITFLFSTSHHFLNSGRSELLYVFITMVVQKILLITEEYRCYQLHTNFYQACLCGY
jgi:hypothetical protein